MRRDRELGINGHTVTIKITVWTACQEELTQRHKDTKGREVIGGASRIADKEFRSAGRCPWSVASLARPRREALEDGHSLPDVAPGFVLQRAQSRPRKRGSAPRLAPFTFISHGVNRVFWNPANRRNNISSVSTHSRNPYFRDLVVSDMTSYSRLKIASPKGQEAASLNR
jgi:hypothetical protein